MLIKKPTAIVGVVAAVCLVATFTGCSSSGSSGDNKTLSIYAWADDLPTKVISNFEKETGIKVTVDTYDSNATMISKVAAGNSGYDLVEPSQSAVSQLVGQDLVSKIDHSKLTGLNGLTSKFADPTYDRGLQYSVPWIWGTTGLLYNEKCTGGPLTDWSALFDPKYKGKIYMLDDMIGAYIPALQSQGLSITTRKQSDINKATDKLLAQKPLLAGYNTTNYAQLVASGDACVALAWSGPSTAAAVESNPDVHYVIPKDGGTIWVDGFSIPKDAQNVGAAYKFLNYLLRPDVAAASSNESSAASVNGAAMKLISPKLANNPAIYTPADQLAHAEFILDPTPILKYLQEGWTKVRAS